MRTSTALPGAAPRRLAVDLLATIDAAYRRRAAAAGIGAAVLHLGPLLRTLAALADIRALALTYIRALALAHAQAGFGRKTVL